MHDGEAKPSPEPTARIRDIEAILDRHFYTGWSNDGPAVGRDEVNDLLEKIGNEVAALSGVQPPNQPTAEQKFDAQWEMRGPLRLALLGLPRKDGTHTNIYEVLSAIDAALSQSAGTLPQTSDVHPVERSGPLSDVAGAGDCPHAAPFRYCDRCKVTPCPIGLGATGNTR